ncbi:MAG: DUF2095 family protein [Hadesarchaea archaeon]|nr:DUF2095 family protein [Hadesarchaea archaeon]
MEAGVGHMSNGVDELRKKYPNLYREWGGVGTLRIGAVRTDPEEARKVACAQHGYEPTVVDFIRRCDTDQQALEIIDFLERRGEISRDYAKSLRLQLKCFGLRSFGSKKEAGYYERG